MEEKPWTDEQWEELRLRQNERNRLRHEAALAELAAQQAEWLPRNPREQAAHEAAGPEGVQAARRFKGSFLAIRTDKYGERKVWVAHTRERVFELSTRCRASAGAGQIVQLP